VVQGDLTLLLETGHPEHEAARDAVVRFAELVKAPEYMHTYRITPLSVWNAAAAGLGAEWMVEALDGFSRYPVPEVVRRTLRDLVSRFGRLRLVREDAAEHVSSIGANKQAARQQPDTAGDGLLLEVDGADLMRQILGHPEVRRYLGEPLDAQRARVTPLERGRLKVALIKAGLPVDDLAGYDHGEPLSFELRSTTRGARPFSLRPYQEDAVAIYHAGGTARGGSGVVVLPCGAGKTVVGMAAMARAAASTVIITTGVTAARQWIAELLDKTTLGTEQIGEYSGQIKEVRPVTVTTYQTLTYRRRKEEDYPHFRLFHQRRWGLVIYDEVHLLPAPVFQLTAGLQARRRLGLTATLVREDGRQDDVFALIGPKKYDVAWKEMERQGWIARAVCTEVRVPMCRELLLEATAATPRRRMRLAAENPDKLPVVRALLARHAGEPTLVIGLYLDQLRMIARELGAPLLTGQTPARRREELYAGFRAGEINVLVVSKVANFAVDLPDAAMAIQVSGTFGSRQEEAQRLGRLLRPKAGRNQAHFYTLVSQDSEEQGFALHRQLFLVEQGYTYCIVDSEEMNNEDSP